MCVSKILHLGFALSSCPNDGTSSRLGAGVIVMLVVLVVVRNIVSGVLFTATWSGADDKGLLAPADDGINLGVAGADEELFGPSGDDEMNLGVPCVVFGRCRSFGASTVGTQGPSGASGSFDNKDADLGKGSLASIAAVCCGTPA